MHIYGTNKCHPLELYQQTILFVIIITLLNYYPKLEDITESWVCKNISCKQVYLAAIYNLPTKLTHLAKIGQVVYRNSY